MRHDAAALAFRGAAARRRVNKDTFIVKPSSPSSPKRISFQMKNPKRPVPAIRNS